VSQSNGCLLVGISGPFEGTRIPVLGNSFSVGRTKEGNQLVLNDTEISRCHAIISVSAAGWSIEDRSANGTFLNDKRIKTAILGEGDLIRFGPSRTNQFVFELESAPAYAPGSSAPAPASTPEMMGVKRTVFEKIDAPPVFQARLQLVIDRFTVQDILLPQGNTLIGRTPAPGKVFVDHLSISAEHARI